MPANSLLKNKMSSANSKKDGIPVQSGRHWELKQQQRHRTMRLMTKNNRAARVGSI